MRTDLTREVVFFKAYDGRDTDPHKDYGIHGVDMNFILRGYEGALVFITFTNWMLPHVAKELEPLHNSVFRKPMAADLGAHRTYAKDEYDIHNKDCRFTKSGECYYDGSSLAAEECLQILIAEGSDALWEYLETRYDDWMK